VAARVESQPGSTPAPRFGLPNLGVGVGLRTAHYTHILEQSPEVAWFEVLSDNYLYTRGRPLEILDRIAERYPLALHGVSLNLGSVEPLDREYIRELKGLRDRVGAHWVSDHVCFTGVAGRNTHDLLPLPLTEEALRHVAERARMVSELLDSRLVLENPSTYVEFAGATLHEWEFMAALAEEADVGLLLDVNNVLVSAKNHGFDPETYLAAIPMQRVVQIHVAGHTDHGTHAIDTHIGPVPDAVWQLYARARALGADAAVLLEWDAEIPPFEIVHADARRAERALAVGEAAGF
jgi:uncharacterized protein (UPF0276 family)